MADVRAFRSGNWSDVTATSPWWNGTAIFAPAAGDNVYSNTFTIAVDISATCTSVTINSATSRTWKDGGVATATGGGTYSLNNGVTLTANVIGPTNTTTQNCVIVSGSVSCGITGNITGGSGFGSTIGVNFSSSGTLTISGNLTGGAGSGSDAVKNSSASGTIAITTAGGITGGAGTGGHGVNNANTGTITISGNVTGGSSGSSNGVNNASTGIVTITGNVTAGTAIPGANNASTGTFTIIGDITATNGVNGFTSSNTGATNRLSGSFINSANGTAAIYAPKFILNSTPLLAKTRYALNGTSTYVDMYTSDNNPNGGVATTDVRLGVSYGGGLVGTCAVPLPSQVAVGVATDNTTGTAALTPADIRTALGLASANMDTQLAVLSNLDTTVSSRLAPSGTLATVTTLTNAPTVPTAAAIASQVRTELATELARVDAAVSTRLAGSAYTAPSNSDVAAIKAKTDLLNTDRLAQASTVATTGAQIAAALS